MKNKTKSIKEHIGIRFTKRNPKNLISLRIVEEIDPLIFSMSSDLTSLKLMPYRCSEVSELFSNFCAIGFGNYEGELDFYREGFLKPNGLPKVRCTLTKTALRTFGHIYRNLWIWKLYKIELAFQRHRPCINLTSKVGDMFKIRNCNVVRPSRDPSSSKMLKCFSLLVLDHPRMPYHSN